MVLTSHYATHLSDHCRQVTPSLLANQQLSLVNRQLANELSLPQTWWRENRLVRLLDDNDNIFAERAVAQKYGGHQFGQWNPYLGDGRGLLLGEVRSNDGERVDLHLKGAGQTPYSRGADGRAVLRSTLREYIGSEALHHLGIPTSRALCLFTSDETVYREQPEQGAMMIRTAPSHIRFGHFEYFYHSGEKAKLNKLFDYTLENHFPECLAAENPHKSLLQAMTLRTARMIAMWQAYGFVHGVMNTDNMSIHGITFDFGPYAFIDNFQSNAVFNHSDHQGRYAFDQQPGIGLWNLNAMAHAFSDFCSTDDIREVLMQYEPIFVSQYQQIMLNRLGLSGSEESDNRLVNDWQDILSLEQRDFTSSFRALAVSDKTLPRSEMRDRFLDRARFDKWWQRYQRRCENNQAFCPSAMRKTNPAVIARTHLLQQAITAAEQGDMSVSENLLNALSSPFDEKWDNHFFSCPPQNDNTVSLSCSS